MRNLYIRDNLEINRDRLLYTKYGRLISSLISIALLSFIFYEAYNTDILLLKYILAALFVVFAFVIKLCKLLYLPKWKVIMVFILKILIFIEPYRYFIALLFVFFPLVLYQLTSGNPNMLPAIKFDVITVSGVLGGIVLTAATLRFRNINRENRRRLLIVALMFAVATILLVIAAINLQLVTIIDSSSANATNTSSTEFSRGYSFWIGAIGFYGGTFAFAFAIIDLLFAILHIIGINKKYNRKSKLKGLKSKQPQRKENNR